MEVEHFSIAGPIHFVMPQFRDSRGYFTEVFNAEKLKAQGIPKQSWVQDNQSCSVDALTLRGLHYQLPPYSQSKIVRVISGRIQDVAVDLRPNSTTYKNWISVELSADRQNQLYIPVGFAHGFLTLTEDVVITYKVSAHYSKAHDRSLNWCDPEIGIRWEIPVGKLPVLSDKDRAALMLVNLVGELEEFR